MPLQPPKWKQVDHLYEDFKKFKRSCTHVFDGPMAHVSDKVKVNMLLLWCGPDGEDIYEGFNLDVHQLYDLELIWSLFDKHCEPICNFYAARWKFHTVAQAACETLDTFYKRILKLAKQCQFEPAEERSRLIDAIIYGMTITKATGEIVTDAHYFDTRPMSWYLQTLWKFEISLGNNQTKVSGSTYRKDTINQRVMVMVETYHSQQQSLVLVLVEAEGPLLRAASVLAVAGHMVTMFAQLRIPFALVVTRKDILRRCVTHPGHSHGHVHLHNKTKL